MNRKEQLLELIAQYEQTLRDLQPTVDSGRAPQSVLKEYARVTTALEKAQTELAALDKEN